MMQSGLNKVWPRRSDPSLLHTFGALDFDTGGLPDNFSIYNGQQIPNQQNIDTRFIPAVRPLPFGCTAESQTFLAGLEDGATYDPADFYFATPPGTDGEGRDMRVSLQTTIDRGFKQPDGTIGAKRTAYFNCYGAGAIDDFDATRIALWINQAEKRGVSVGSYWYFEFEKPNADGSLPLPSFNTALSTTTMHNHIITGWRAINGVVELEDISWQGEDYANAGIDYISRELYNALMAQPWTGAFTITKMTSQTPVPIGWQAVVDHLVYYVRNLFKV